MPPPAAPTPQPQPAAMPSVNQPLPQVVAGGVPAGAAGCVSCSYAAECPLHKRGSRPCLQRLKDWACHQPCPRVLPILTPTPYQAPLRTYFPCTPDAHRAAAPGCASHCRPNLLSRLHGAPADCANCPAPRVSLTSRFLRFFDPKPHPYNANTWAGADGCGGTGCSANGAGTGDCPCPPTPAYRYAAPCVVPPPSSPYQQLHQGATPSTTYPLQGATQRSPASLAASRPFTTP
jgi:hypothetical protein